MTDLDDFREKWKVELGLKENEKLNQGKKLLKLIRYVWKNLKDLSRLVFKRLMHGWKRKNVNELVKWERP